MNNEGRKVGKGHITNRCKCPTKELELYTEATNLICREKIKHFYQSYPQKVPYKNTLKKKKEQFEANEQETQKLKSFYTINADEDMEKLDLLHITGGNLKQCTILEKLGSFLR